MGGPESSANEGRGLSSANSPRGMSNANTRNGSSNLGDLVEETPCDDGVLRPRRALSPPPTLLSIYTPENVITVTRAQKKEEKGESLACSNGTRGLPRAMEPQSETTGATPMDTSQDLPETFEHAPDMLDDLPESSDADVTTKSKPTRPRGGTGMQSQTDASPKKPRTSAAHATSTAAALLADAEALIIEEERFALENAPQAGHPRVELALDHPQEAGTQLALEPVDPAAALEDEALVQKDAVMRTLLANLDGFDEDEVGGLDARIPLCNPLEHVAKCMTIVDAKVRTNELQHAGRFVQPELDRRRTFVLLLSVVAAAIIAALDFFPGIKFFKRLSTGLSVSYPPLVDEGTKSPIAHGDRELAKVITYEGQVMTFHMKAPDAKKIAATKNVPQMLADAGVEQLLAWGLLFDQDKVASGGWFTVAGRQAGGTLLPQFRKMLSSFRLCTKDDAFLHFRVEFPHCNLTSAFVNMDIFSANKNIAALIEQCISDGPAKETARQAGPTYVLGSVPITQNNKTIIVFACADLPTKAVLTVLRAAISQTTMEKRRPPLRKKNV